MKKAIFIILATAFSVNVEAQFGNLLKKDKDKGNGTSESHTLPKGIEMYTAEHKDDKGVSGKYFTKYPVKLIAKNMMNMDKPFYMSEVTIELRENLSGVFHFVNDEPKNKIRYESTDMNTTFDFGTGNMNPEVVKKSMEKCKCVNLTIKNSFMPKESRFGFKDGASFIVYSKDPDIIFIGSPRISDYKSSGKKGYFMENGMDFLGGQLNVLSKDKAKLAQWDSAKIADALFEEWDVFGSKVTSAFGEVAEMPKQFVDDNAREQEYLNLIKPNALTDKPVAWGDRIDYVYLSTDWAVKYKDVAKKIPSHRFLNVIAVSSKWPNNECRYIPCVIKQNWEGTDFGKAYFSGFVGALVPISCEKAKAFKH